MANQRRFAKTIGHTRWQGFSGTAFGLSAGSSAVSVGPSSVQRETIMRTRGNLIAYIDGLVNPAIAIRCACGLAVVPEGTSTTVLWGPLTDQNAPWFWHTIFVVGYEEYVADVIDAPGLSVYREVIDSKAMRKFPPDSEIQLVFEQDTIAGLGDVNFSANGRFLIGQ